MKRLRKNLHQRKICAFTLYKTSMGDAFYFFTSNMLPLQCEYLLLPPCLHNHKMSAADEGKPTPERTEH